MLTHRAKKDNWYNECSRTASRYYTEILGSENIDRAITVANKEVDWWSIHDVYAEFVMSDSDGCEDPDLIGELFTNLRDLYTNFFVEASDDDIQYLSLHKFNAIQRYTYLRFLIANNKLEIPSISERIEKEIKTELELFYERYIKLVEQNKYLKI